MTGWSGIKSAGRQESRRRQQRMMFDKEEPIDATQLVLKNPTVFAEVDFQFAPDLTSLWARTATGSPMSLRSRTPWLQ